MGVLCYQSIVDTQIFCVHSSMPVGYQYYVLNWTTVLMDSTTVESVVRCTVDYYDLNENQNVDVVVVHIELVTDKYFSYHDAYHFY